MDRKRVLENYKGFEIVLTKTSSGIYSVCGKKNRVTEFYETVVYAFFVERAILKTVSKIKAEIDNIPSDDISFDNLVSAIREKEKAGKDQR